VSGGGGKSLKSSPKSRVGTQVWGFRRGNASVRRPKGKRGKGGEIAAQRAMRAKEEKKWTKIGNNSYRRHELAETETTRKVHNDYVTALHRGGQTRRRR